MWGGSGEVAHYGRSAGGWPLFAIKLRGEAPASAPTAPRPAVVITGAIHGYEYLNIADRLPLWFWQNREEAHGVRAYLRAGGVLFIVPVFNPDGFIEGKRYNANEVDLNRDYPLRAANKEGFTQPETRLFNDYLERELALHGLTLKFVLSYHCCGRYDTQDVAQLGYPWAYTLDPLGEASDLKTFQRLAGAIVGEFPAGTTIAGSWAEMIRDVAGTDTDFYYEKHHAYSFIFEGLEVEEPKRFDSHTRFWNYVLGEIGAGKL